MDFVCRINMDNDAFVAYPEISLAELLKKVAQRIKSGEVYGNILDTNGNKVGTFDIID